MTLVEKLRSKLEFDRDCTIRAADIEFGTQLMSMIRRPEAARFAVDMARAENLRVQSFLTEVLNCIEVFEGINSPKARRALAQLERILE